MKETAVLLANDMFRSVHAKTSHGLVRGPCRYQIVAVVDQTCTGEDSGELLDGVHRGIPIVSSVAALLSRVKPDRCIVGVATPGGVLPDSLHADLVTAARAGVGLVNGLHTLLADDPAIAAAAAEGGSEILDIRRPRPVKELCHWRGDSTQIQTPRLAILGTDCAIGKRTTATLLTQRLEDEGVKTEMLSTGQTGFLQGARHGFFFDATPNDFVSGELERAVLECVAESKPRLIVLEGQSSFFNPSGPCGAELILSAGAKHVVIQHAPRREYHLELHHVGARIPPVEKHIAMAELLGAEVIAVTLNQEGMNSAEAKVERDRLRDVLNIPVLLPLTDGVDELASVVRRRVLEEEG